MIELQAKRPTEGHSGAIPHTKSQNISIFLHLGHFGRHLHKTTRKRHGLRALCLCASPHLLLRPTAQHQPVLSCLRVAKRRSQCRSRARRRLPPVMWGRGGCAAAGGMRAPHAFGNGVGCRRGRFDPRRGFRLQILQPETH